LGRSIRLEHDEATFRQARNKKGRQEMKRKLSTLGLVLILGALIFSGCGSGPAQPTELPTATPAEAVVEVPADVRSARDAALTYISENYPEQAAPPGLTWAEEPITPEGLVGWVTYEFTAEDWVITIGTAVVPPETRRYEVVVDNPITGFWWEGRVDAEGHVTEGPGDVLNAHAAALVYISENYPDDSPAPDLTWEGGRTTPEGLLGSETFQYTADDWMVTISYPVVAPEEVVYQIMVENPTTSFRWQGMLDAEGYLIEMLAPTEGDFQPLSPTACSDLADDVAQTLGVHVATTQAPFEDYRNRKTGRGCEITASGTGLDFESFRTGSEDLFWTLFEELKAMLTAQGWQEDTTYQLDGPTGTGTGFHKERGLCLLIVGWQPSEDADCPTDQPIYACELTPEQQIYTMVLNCAEAAPTAGQPVMCWYSRVDSAPEDSAIDDYLVLLPEQARRAVDVTGADEAIEAEIEALRDTGTYAHFWGPLNCDLGCQLVVTRLRPEGPEGPFFDPDPVEGWEGTIVSNPPDAQFDDYFVLAGSIPVRYGIDSADATIAAQLENLRDTGSIIRVWGQVTCPAIDFHGTLIQVTRLEVAIEAPAAGEGYEGWNAYTSAKFGYTLRYPGECTVMGSNLDQSVQFADVNKYWPVLTVRHYDSDFYHPPAGTDVRQWIADRDVPYDEIDPEAEIAGLPAVHLMYEEGPGWNASDEYYFIQGDQLFSILILHADGQQDWDLYNKFLKSFTFVTEAAVEGQPLTLEALKNAAYLSEWPADGVAQLVDGEYEEEIVPGAASKLIIVFYPDMYAFGDLDGDGAEDAAVVLATSGGGSGTFISLEAVINDQGTPNHVATAFLGDRVQVNSVAIESGEITIDMVTHGPDDPLCCPSLKVTQKYGLQGDKLVQLSDQS